MRVCESGWLVRREGEKFKFKSHGCCPQLFQSQSPSHTYRIHPKKAQHDTPIKSPIEYTQWRSIMHCDLQVRTFCTVQPWNKRKNCKKGPSSSAHDRVPRDDEAKVRRERRRARACRWGVHMQHWVLFNWRCNASEHGVILKKLMGDDAVNAGAVHARNNQVRLSADFFPIRHSAYCSERLNPPVLVLRVIKVIWAPAVCEPTKDLRVFVHDLGDPFVSIASIHLELFRCSTETKPTIGQDILPHSP